MSKTLANALKAIPVLALAAVVAAISLGGSGAGDPVIEFYNSDLDHYFITANAGEAAAIDSGSAGPGWRRTGSRFGSGGSVAVCRFYGSQSPGPNSHFYTANAEECASLKALQATTPATEKRWNFESLDFQTTVPVDGACPAGTTPVYRAYNNGFARNIDSNHRITADPDGIQQVVNRGWISEGVVMCGAGAAQAGSSYATSFPNTENPLSEGGKWMDGKSVGLDWNNPQSAAGKAYASVLSGATGSRYDDSVAHLSTSVAAFAPDQFAQGTVYRVAGYAPSGSGHEVELLLRFQITPHNARGYEVLWGHSGYVAIVRWNGPVGDYTALLDTGDPGIGAPVDGDVLRAEITGSVIKVYKNGALVITGPSNRTWSDGQPGLGFWPVDRSTPQNLGWKSYSAGNL